MDVLPANRYLFIYLFIYLYAERFHRKLIDEKTLLKVDQNENAYIHRISVDGQKKKKKKQ